MKLRACGYRVWGIVCGVLLLLAGCNPGGGAGGTQGGAGGGGAGGGATTQVRRTLLGEPLVRVRLLEGQSGVKISASADPVITVQGDPAPKRLAMSGRTIQVSLTQGGWSLGGAVVGGTGTLSLSPRPEGSVSVNGQAYRGAYRFVPVGGGKFDVVNDVDIDGYLKSVVSKELLKDWHPEAFRAQAIVARTYALYEITTAGGVGGAGSSKYWDLYDDERSQVYGGLSAETKVSRESVDATKGIVVAEGPVNQEHIFKAYFSSCCGGIGQSAQDAFGDPAIEALSAKNMGSLCASSPRYQWGPVALTKTEVTRRIRLWAERRNRAEVSINTVLSIQPSHVNQFGRPVRYLLTDVRGQKYSLEAEEFRTALNAAGEGRTVWSGFMTIKDGGATFIFSGRGSGHGVGMCQYCAEAMALRGMRHEDIVRASYPGSTLIRAY